MKFLASISLSLLISAASFAQPVMNESAPNNTNSNLVQFPVSPVIGQPNVVKVGKPAKLINSNTFNSRQSLSNPLLNVGYPFTTTNPQPMGPNVAASLKNGNTPSSNNNPITFTSNVVVNNNTFTAQKDSRSLPLNKDGKLLSVDGHEITFEVPQSSKNTGICGTPMPTMKSGNKNIACGFNVPCDDPANRDLVDTTTIDYFQLRWLVFTNGGPSTNIDQTRINALMAELNADFASHSMVFCADPATFLDRPNWYNHNAAVDEFPMKDSFNVNPTQVINIYVVGTSQGNGGYARMPYDPNGGTSSRGGIVLARGNMSVGTHTLSHEMGHTFGLFHTFAGVTEKTPICGNNCYEQVRNANGSSNTSGVPTPLGGPYLNEGDREGDWCSDTHPHPQNPNLCPGPAGTTGPCDAFPRVPANFPHRNHMSYSFCSNMFTSQQERRMHCMVDQYLGQWTAYGGGVCGAQPPVADFVGSPTSWIAPNNVTFTDLSLPTAIITSWTWTFDVAGGNGVTCAGCVGPNATYTGQTPPVVTYPNVGTYDVSLTVTSANGPSTETKLSYINVVGLGGDCDTLDTAYYNPPTSFVTYTTNSGTRYMTGVPSSGNASQLSPAGYYQQYFTPTPGSSVVGAVTVALSNLIDPNDNMTFQVVVYEDSLGLPKTGNGPAAVRAFSPTQLNVPGAGFYQRYNIPFLCAPTIDSASFHVGVEMFPGDAGDRLTLISNTDGQGNGASLTNSYSTVSCGRGDFNVGPVHCFFAPLDFDLLCYPQMGWYRPTPVALGFNEVVNCDTTQVAIFTNTLYDGSGCPPPSGPNPGMVSWTYIFADGTTINSPTEVPVLNRTYTSPGQDTLTIMAMNSCGRADTTVWLIPYSFSPTPDAEFSKTPPNPVCDTTTVIFTANTGGYQDYTWDFGDGSGLFSSGNSPTASHVYGTPGLYYTTLTTTSLGYQPIDTFYLEDFESGWPAGYTRASLDGLTPNAAITPPFGPGNNFAWIAIDANANADTAAVSTSWYTAPGQSDDWMVTSAIGVLPANQMLTWDAEAGNATVADGYEVRISTSAAPINTTNFSTVLFTVGAENAFRTKRSVDLSSYAGQTVYIAFRNTSNDKFILSIDNIRVGTIGPGCSATITKPDFVQVVDCNIQPPVADLLASDSVGCAPLTITFTDNTSQVPHATTSWLWNFGDATFSTLQNPPPHVYATPGTYFVSMQACNAGGCSTDYLTVVVGTGVVSAAGPNQSLCGSTSTTLAGNNPAPGTGLWTLVAGSGTITSPTSPTSGVTGLGIGANTFAWTITSPGCVSVDSVTITVVPAPNAGTAGTHTFCSTDPPANLLPDLGGADTGGTWTGPLPILTNGDSGTFTPGTNVAGVYTYTVTGIPPCANAAQTVTVTVNTTPVASAPANVTACDSFQLPPVAVGNYFSASGGVGPIPVGTWITSTQTIFVYAETSTVPNCTDENSFTVTINTTPVASAPANVTACDSFQLPPVAVGNYFSASGGVGPIPVGTWITSTQTIFVYAETSTVPNCTDENSFTVTINTTPVASAPANVTACDSFQLPPVAVGNYFSASGGVGPIPVGTWITSTQTIFVYAETSTVPNCTDENSFTVTINTTPVASAPANVSACDSFQLPPVAVGNYFSASGGVGPIPVGTWITSTQTIFVYAETSTVPNCTDENSFTVTITPSPNAGTNNTLGICPLAPATNLLPLLGGADAGGTWIGPLPALTNGDQGTFTPGTNVAGTYQYIVTGIAPCTNDTANVVVTISPSDDPTFTYPDFCAGSGGLPGVINTPGGTFSFNPDPFDGATIVPATGAIANAVGGSTYFIKYVTPAGPCQDSLTISVNIGTPVNAGTAGTHTFCSTDPAANLLPDLGGADTGGTWTGPLPVLTNGDSGTFTPGINVAGVYTYTVIGTNGCPNASQTVTVTVNTTPVASAPANVTACDSFQLAPLAVGNYFSASGGVGPIPVGTWITSTQTIFVYAETSTVPNCTDENSFTVTINTSPVASAPANVTACDSFQLPPVAVGNYFSASGGVGPIPVGTWITSTQTIFVYAETSTVPNCTDENSFTVTINTTPVASAPANVTACDSFQLAPLAVGNYFSASGGVGPIPVGTWITSTQTIFVYAETSTVPNCTDENSFTVTINTSPVASAPANVTACDSFQLPPVAVGNYFSASGGVGPIPVGTWITSTQTIFVYAETSTVPNCTDENSFTVTINTTPVASAPANVTACDSFQLPPVAVGNYFSASGGVGPIPVGTWITSTQTIFVYAETSTVPNCTDENSFTVTINTTPVASAPANVTACDSFQLPPVAVGNYFSASGGVGPIPVGTWITSTQTIFVYAETSTVPNCTDENSFTVTINTTPVASAPANVSACDSFQLPPVAVGNYFSASGGVGPIPVGTWITSTQTIFVYAETSTVPNCTDENSFTVTITPSPNAGTDTSISLCIVGPATNLLPLLGGADAGGTWIGPLPALTNGDQGTFTPGTNVAGTYQYIVTGTPPCSNDTASVVVTITTNDDPTFTYPDFCAGSGGLPGTINTPGGTFSFNPDPGDGATIVPGTGAIANEVGGSTYFIKYVTPAGPCQDSLTISVNIGTPVNAGTAGTHTFCSNDTAANLLPDLGGADPGGTWTGPSALTNGDQGTFTPGTNIPGFYTYTVTGTNGCPDASQTVTVTINSAGNAGTDSTLSVCSTDGTTDLFTLLGGADIGGVWSPALASTTGVFDPGVDPGGVYTYTVTNAPCSPVSATITVTVNTPPNAGTDNSLTVCSTDPTTDLFTLLGGADAGGTWSPTMVSGTGVYDPSIDPTGVYTYTVTAIAPCTDATATVNVILDNSGCNTEPFFISNMLTPNDDGKNDTWYIGNVGEIQGSPVMIFNRWGTKIFETTNYNNDWDGTYNGEKLPDGSYFYVIEHKGETFQGPITLLRTAK